MALDKAAILERLHSLKQEIEDLIDSLAEGEPPAPPQAVGSKLAVVVGHTQESPGAFGQAPVNQNEYFWNGDLADRMKRHAEGVPGLAVEVFFRDQGGISGAYRRAGEWGADACIELHFNSFEGNAKGTETIYVTDRSKALAQALQDAMVGALSLRDRGIKPPQDGRGRQSLTQLDVPSVIVEPFFGSNRADCERAVEKKDQLAATLVDTADNLLGA